MGPVDWIAVIVAALAATAVQLARRGLATAGRAARPGPLAGDLAATLLVMLMAAWLMGHNFARVGAETLAAKPWLYWMMSGGFALFIASPAVWLTAARHGQPPKARLVDAGFWLAAFLAMGTVFRLLG